MPRYEPDAYWSGLLEDSFTLKSVGVVGRSLAFNDWGYRARRAAVDRMVPDARGLRVLDVGSGTGHWIAYWQARDAAEVAGVDLTPVSVERLRARFPGVRIEQSDVSRELSIDGPFDLVSAMDVLLHITDDAGYGAALRNLRAAVTPGARLLMLEPIATGPPRPMKAGAHSKTRALGFVRTALAEAGWRIERLQPATWLYSNPIEIEPRAAYLALTAAWKATSLAARPEWGGRLAGAAIYPLDRWLCRLPWGPSAKLVLARAA